MRRPGSEDGIKRSVCLAQPMARDLDALELYLDVKVVRHREPNGFGQREQACPRCDGFSADHGAWQADQTEPQTDKGRRETVQRRRWEIGVLCIGSLSSSHVNRHT